MKEQVIKVVAAITLTIVVVSIATFSIYGYLSRKEDSYNYLKVADGIIEDVEANRIVNDSFKKLVRENPFLFDDKEVVFDDKKVITKKVDIVEKVNISKKPTMNNIKEVSIVAEVKEVTSNVPTWKVVRIVDVSSHTRIRFDPKIGADVFFGGGAGLDVSLFNLESNKSDYLLFPVFGISFNLDSEVSTHIGIKIKLGNILPLYGFLSYSFRISDMSDMPKDGISVGIGITF